MKISGVFPAAAALLLAAELVLSGCGTGKLRTIAYVGNTESGESRQISSMIWRGVKSYAKTNDLRASIYKPSDFSAASAYNSIREAVSGGADIVICSGDATGSAVYSLQNKQIHTRFLVLDGKVSPAGDTNKERIRGNTFSVGFKMENAGYLAGYSAVAEGYTDLAYLGGAESDENIRYGSGFIQGAEAAARKYLKDNKKVTIRCGYIPSNAIQPSQVSSIKKWLGDDCRILAVSGTGPEYLAEEAVKQTDVKLITSDMSSDPGGRTIADAGVNYSAAAKEALKQIKSGKLSGGTKTWFGIKEDSIYLKQDASSWKTFTGADYRSLIGDITSGSLKITEEDVSENLKKHHITHCRIKTKTF